LPVEAVGKLYFSVGARVRLGWLRLCAARIVATSHWERLAVQSLIGDLYDEQRRLTGSVIEVLCKDKSCPDSADAWAEAHAEDLQRFESFIDDLKAGESLDIPKLMVALQHVRSL
jgi:glutamate dehydrogenase